MAMNYNRVILTGNLVSDPETKTVGQSQVSSFALAINHKFRKQSGEVIEEVSFVDITAWAKLSEIAEQYLEKGKPVLVEGRLKQDRWEKDGEKRSKHHVIAEKIVMLGGGGGDQDSSRTSSAPAGVGADDDIPF